MKYLLIQFFRKPQGQIDEQVTVSKKIKPSDLQTSNVILNFADRKVEKCVIEGKVHDSTFDKLYEYYKNIYPNLVEQLDKANAILVKPK